MSTAVTTKTEEAETGLTYQGWRLIVDADSDGERMTYYAERGAERRGLHWSPFKTYRAEHFGRYIDLGFPAAETGNVFPDEIDELWLSRSAAA
jgi:hypothetical protein